MLRAAAMCLSMLVGAAALTVTADADAAAKRKVASSQKAPSSSKARGAKPGARATKAERAPRSSRTASRKGGASRAGRRTSRTVVEAPASSPRAGTLTILPRTISCPPDMVAVAGRVCVDRFETTVVDGATGATWSPFYTPDVARARGVAAFYEELRARRGPTSLATLVPLPPLPATLTAPRAASVPSVVPQGYLSGEQADALCRAAGKRLCTESEWLTACRGEQRRDFPYGDRYEHGTCNVWREDHPSSMLHGNAARYHDDPRNGLLEAGGRTLAQPTGASPRCASRWGDDAIFDMVGNLDEWIADPSGVFVGGFYSRASRAGCLARVSNHVRAYSDYSTGTRCCADPSEPT